MHLLSDSGNSELNQANQSPHAVAGVPGSDLQALERALLKGTQNQARAKQFAVQSLGVLADQPPMGCKLPP